MVLCAHTLQVQVILISVGNEGYFTIEDEIFSRPYLRQDCSGVTEQYHMVLPAHALQAVEVRLKSVSNEGHFTLDPERVFRPYLP
jgi:hypothetical protein